MADPQLLAACVLLAVGTYLIRLAGTTSQETQIPEAMDRGLDQAVMVILGAVAATSTLYDGQDLASWTRAAGVFAGGAAAALRLPVLLVVIIAGLTTALIRLAI